MSDKTELYIEKATKLIEGLPQRELRLNYLDDFKALGLPTKKVEDYKYSNLEARSLDELNIAGTPDKSEDNLSKALGELPCQYRAIFLNGIYQSESSKLPEGLTLEEKELDKKTACSDPFEALNYALAPKSYQLIVKKNAKVEPVALVHLFVLKDNETVLPQLTVTAESGSQSCFLEVFASQGTTKTQSFTNTQFLIEDNAHTQHIKALLTDLGHTHVGKFYATLKRDAHLNSLTFSAAGGLNRNNIDIRVQGEGAHATANGLFTARGEQHQDNFSHIHHEAAHSTSDQVFKGIIDDNARGAFTGKIIIHRDAQKVESTQLNKNLLLSKKAHVDTRPQIEVYADDVKCGHGATVGQINEEEVFYLESRGIPRYEAQKILCHAFGQEVLDSCHRPAITAWMSAKLFELFEQYALERFQQGEN